MAQMQSAQMLNLLGMLGINSTTAFVKGSPATEGVYRDLPDWLSEATRGVLQQQGYGQLYRHQVEAIEAALLYGEDVIITTPTASGKSMAFQVPMVEAAMAATSDKEPGRSLYLAPAKALIADQRGKFNNWAAGGRLKVVTLTGDTPGDRAELFRPVPDILLTNPDCLNSLLLKQAYPQFAGLKRFLKELRFVVIDEMQSFTGAFGCNSAHLIRRVKLAVRRAGGDPQQIQFILASATIGNPQQLWQTLCGREASHPHAWVSHNAAPFPGRIEVFRNGKGCNRGAVCRMASTLVTQGASTIVFVESRRMGRELVALMRKELRRLGYQETLADQFHGTLNGTQRQQIAERIRQGKLRLVVATSALEQGVDFPQIDAVIVWGFPGINQLMQRFGRAGRGGQMGLSIFVPHMARNTDRYFAAHCRLLAEALPESVYINPGYRARLKQHLLAAAGESGIHIRGELQQVFGEMSAKVALELKQQGKLFNSNDAYLVADLKSAREIAMRGEPICRVCLIDEDTQKVIEEFSYSLALRELHPGAIYAGYDQQGCYRKWQVKRFDYQQMLPKAVAKRIETESPFTTRPVVEVSVKPDQQESTSQRVITLKGGISGVELQVSLGWGEISQEIRCYDRLLARTEVACPNPHCRGYRHRLPHYQAVCKHCEEQLQIVESTTELDYQYELEQPLVNSYQAPILTLSLNTAGQQQAEEWVAAVRQKLIEQYGEVPLKHDDLLVQPADAVALHSLSHLLLAALPIHSQPIAASDLLVVEQGQYSVRLFDEASMGTGCCEFVYAALEELARAAYHIAAECDCELGCPRCCHVDAHCTIKSSGVYKQLGIALSQAMLPR